MLKVRILSRGQLIGFVELEAGDPPMGVAFGSLRPTAEYDAIKHIVHSLMDHIINHNYEEYHKVDALLEIAVELMDGTPLEYSFVEIKDISDIEPDEPARIEVIGVGKDCDVYKQYFGEDAGYREYYSQD